ncbi:MAG: polymerase, partial [Alphaproteobacteria bacterium]|nr:polymerase [Alphaproteobacteria bacterium]
MGFCNILLRVLDEAGDAHIAVVFDPSGPNFRNELYDRYKANRSAPPEELKPQFALVKEATDAFGIVRLETPGFEADDLIATYTREAVERGYEVRIISSDKDLMQLVRDGVRLVDPIKFGLIGPEQVMEKFGVTPDKVVDIQALAGDSSDNVPGVPSIGVKTAAELINLYGDLENLLANLENIKQPKRREVLTQHAEMARISKKLVQLDHNVPLPKDFDDLCPHTPDLTTLGPFLRTQGFRTILSRVEKKWDLAAAREIPTSLFHEQEKEEQPLEAVERHYELVTTMEQLETWIARGTQNGMIALDTETTSLTPAQAQLVGISLSTAPGVACYIPVGHVKENNLFGDNNDADYTQLDKKLVIEKLKPLLENESILKIGQNLKYDWQMFFQEGVRI